MIERILWLFPFPDTPTESEIFHSIARVPMNPPVRRTTMQLLPRVRPSRRRWGKLSILLLALMDSVGAVAGGMHPGRSRFDEASSYERGLQVEPIDDDFDDWRQANDESSTQEADDAPAYPSCVVCQGVPVQEDLIPYPDDAPGITCSMLNMGFLEDSFDYCRSTPDFQFIFEGCCKASIPHYKCEENVHRKIFSGDYNAAVPPIPGTGPGEELVVNVGFQFQAIEEIKVPEGLARVFVTMSIQWTDPRLQWEVEDNDTCANQINVFTGFDVETAKIWIPDFNLMNRISGIQDMPATQAVVYADGTVVWQLSGGLTAFCAFTGLAKIPYDVLGCQMLFGAYARTITGLIKYKISEPEYLFYGNFDTTYNEWQVVPELGTLGEAFGVDSGVIFYNVFFKRSTEFYVNSIVLPTAIMTYLSFFTYLLDLRMGERLGFSMALALVVVAQKIITADMMPTSDQRLWLDNFVSRSFYWVLATVVQSVVVGYLYYWREDLEEKDAEALTVDEDELEPLTITNVDDGDERKEDTATSATKGVLNGLLKRVVLKFPMRTIDFISLLASTVSYTAYIIYMYGTLVGDYWLVDEPVWFDENSTLDQSLNIYINGDPNN